MPVPRNIQISRRRNRNNARSFPRSSAPMNTREETDRRRLICTVDRPKAERPLTKIPMVPQSTAASMMER